MGLLEDTVVRFLRHDDSTARRAESLTVPLPLRGSPELGLIWALLGTMAHYERHCTGAEAGGGSGGGRSGDEARVCQALGERPLGRWPWASLAAAASDPYCRSGYGVSLKTGREYHARGANEVSVIADQ